MKTDNKKKIKYKSFISNKKNIGKIIILLFLIVLSIAIYLKIRSNVIEENLFIFILPPNSETITNLIK